MSRPTNVSIIIPTLVRLESIGETLKSIAANDFDGIELDVSISVNSRYTDRFEPLEKRGYPFSLGVFFEPTTGKAHAINHVLDEHPKLGDIIVILDDDISVSPSWLQNVVAVTERWPNHFYFTGATFIVWPDLPIPDWVRYGNLYNWAFSSFCRIDKDDFELPLSGSPSGNHFWFRKAALDGGRRFRIFDCDAKTHVEMAEPAFMMDLSAEGKRGVATSKAICGHRIQSHLLQLDELERRAVRTGRCFGRVFLQPFRKSVPIAVRFRENPIFSRLRCGAAAVKWSAVHWWHARFPNNPKSIAAKLEASLFYHQNLEMLHIASNSGDYPIFKRKDLRSANNGIHPMITPPGTTPANTR